MTSLPGSPGPVRIGNCSGFYGDRRAAMREMLTGGDLDYLTGDYLAELTMLILARDRAKSPDYGYAKTFLTQLEDCLGTALDRGVRIVANAGGLNPAGLAEAVRELAERLRPDRQRGLRRRRRSRRAGRRVRIRHTAGGECVPRRLGHRRLPQCRRRCGRHRPGHRRVGHRRPCRGAPRLDPHRLRPVGGRDRRRPRHGVRCQATGGTIVLHRDRRPVHPGFPLAEIHPTAPR